MNKNIICNKGHLRVKSCKFEHQNKTIKHSKGPSSYHMQDPEIVFKALNLQNGDVFLDLGCGAGDYSIEAAKIIGNSGRVYAIDVWKGMIESFTERAEVQGLTNIKAITANITEPLPLAENSCSICFIATVLHTLDMSKADKLFNEIYRVLKPGGGMTIIECKKDDLPFGPPKHLRLSPLDLENIICKYGFEKLDVIDLGHNYLIQFCTKK